MQSDQPLEDAKNLYEELYRFVVRCFYDDRTIVLIDFLVSKAKEDDKNQDVIAIASELRIDKSIINQTLAKCSLAEKKKTNAKNKALPVNKETNQPLDKEAWTLNDEIVKDLRALIETDEVKRLKKERISEEFLRCNKCNREYKFDDNCIVRQSKPYECPNSLCSGIPLIHMKRDELQRAKLQEDMDKRKKIFAEIERIIREIEKKNYDFPYIKKKVVEVPLNQNNSEENAAGLGLGKAKPQEIKIENETILVSFIRPFFRERFKTDIRTKEILDKILEGGTHFEIEHISEEKKEFNKENKHNLGKKIDKVRDILTKRRACSSLSDKDYEEIFKKTRFLPNKV